MTEHVENNTSSLTSDTSNKRVSIPVLDPDEFTADLENFDLTEEQAKELLQVLWNIMCGFVELGFGTSSIQRILPRICGEFSEAGLNTLQLSHSKSETKNSQEKDEDNA